MDGCRERRKDLLLYVDRELDPDRTIAFESHVEGCALCAAFVERNALLEEALEATLSPALDRRRSNDFVSTVRERINAAGAGAELQTTAGIQDRRRRIRAFCTLAAAAAAATFLFWIFHSWSVPGEEDGGDKNDLARTSGTGPGGQDLRTNLWERKAGPPLAGIDRAKHRAARKRIAAILASLAPVPDSTLPARFTEAAAPLRREGWRVDVLVAGALKREEGPPLETAIRLARVLPGFEKNPDVVQSLAWLTGKSPVALAALRTLASFEGRRAGDVLADALGDPELRDAALQYLSTLGGPEAARGIAEAALGTIERESAVTPFAAASIRTLAGLGKPGMEGILEICNSTGCTSGLVRALSPVSPETARALAASFDSARGSALEAALRLAASLRLSEALPYLPPRSAGRSPLKRESPRFIAEIGGPAAVVRLVRLYGEPVSLNERRELAAALAEVFELHPEEIDLALRGALKILEEEEGAGDVLIEMLSQRQSAGSCLALAWFVEKNPALASRAALGLARTGSPEALAVLLDLFGRDGIDEETRVAAGAAAYHLGGRPVLERILAAHEGVGASGEKGGVPPVRRQMALSDSRFRKIQKYIAKYAKP
jgi:hypothetical protein